jgi:hypothetical protein
MDGFFRKEVENHLEQAALMGPVEGVESL